MSITIMQSHQKSKNVLLMMSINLRRLRTTDTSTCTDCKWLVICILIPQGLKFCKVRTYWEWSLLEMCNFLPKLKQPWSITLRQPILEINPQISSIFNYITLAFKSRLSELVNQESTVVLHLLQELYNGEDESGSAIYPSTKPNLFLELKAKNTDRAQLM